jgi:pimeloyl-ACP methyl ester carboxylesterase
LNPKKLVLLASAGIRSEDSVKKSLYKAVAKTGRLLSRTLPKKTQQKLRRRLYEAAGSDILISPDLEETFKKVVSYDAEADAAKITQPTILIYTQDDTATPSRYGVKLHNAIKDSKLTILPDGGHFVHQTQSQAVLDLMKEHIK